MSPTPRISPIFQSLMLGCTTSPAATPVYPNRAANAANHINFLAERVAVSSNAATGAQSHQIYCLRIRHTTKMAARASFRPFRGRGTQRRKLLCDLRPRDQRSIWIPAYAGMTRVSKRAAFFTISSFGGRNSHGREWPPASKTRLLSALESVAGIVLIALIYWLRTS